MKLVWLGVELLHKGFSLPSDSMHWLYFMSTQRSQKRPLTLGKGTSFAVVVVDATSVVYLSDSLIFLFNSTFSTTRGDARGGLGGAIAPLGW